MIYVLNAENLDSHCCGSFVFAPLSPPSLCMLFLCISYGMWGMTVIECFIFSRRSNTDNIVPRETVGREAGTAEAEKSER